MSYILDALRKAERERNRARVPTLMTLHPRARWTERWAAHWVVAGVLLAGGGVSLWLLRPVPPGSPPAAMDSRTDYSAPLPANPANPGRPSASGSTVGAPPPASATRVSPGPGAGHQREASRQPSRERPGSPPPISSPRAVEPAPLKRLPVRGTLDPSGAKPAPAEPLTAPQTDPGPGAAPVPATAVAQPSPSSPANPPILRDAMAKMTLDVLVHTEVEARRMVVISGRKYVEGDRVDGLYLLESITPEGAVLSYQGERALLRP